MRKWPVLFTCLLCVGVKAQTNFHSPDLKPDKEYDHIFTKPLAGDSLSSSFMIWIKDTVRVHMHEFHSEHIYVLAGEADFYFNDEVKRISAGDVLFIPKKNWHAVKVRSKEPLQVISVQSPGFDGKDRVFFEETKAIHYFGIKQISSVDELLNMTSLKIIRQGMATDKAFLIDRETGIKKCNNCTIHAEIADLDGELFKITYRFSDSETNYIDTVKIYQDGNQFSAVKNSFFDQPVFYEKRTAMLDQLMHYFSATSDDDRAPVYFLCKEDESKIVLFTKD